MLKVAAIEFDEDLKEILEIFLRDEGYAVSCFNSFNILPQLLTLKPDVIILDYFLHFDEASQFCSQLKKQPSLKSVPVILSSVDINIGKIATKLCAQSYLPKPFDLEELKDKIDSLCEGCGE